MLETIKKSFAYKFGLTVSEASAFLFSAIVFCVGVIIRSIGMNDAFANLKQKENAAYFDNSEFKLDSVLSLIFLTENSTSYLKSDETKAFDLSNLRQDEKSGKIKSTTKNKSELKEKSVNINKAKAEELEKLPGIGKKTAEAIIQFRKENGPFEKVEDIMKVKGIGESKFQKIKSYIYVD